MIFAFAKRELRAESLVLRADGVTFGDDLIEGVVERRKPKPFTIHHSPFTSSSEVLR